MTSQSMSTPTSIRPQRPGAGESIEPPFFVKRTVCFFIIPKNMTETEEPSFEKKKKKPLQAKPKPLPPNIATDLRLSAEPLTLIHHQFLKALGTDPAWEHGGLHLRTRWFLASPPRRSFMGSEISSKPATKGFPQLFRENHMTSARGFSG